MPGLTSTGVSRRGFLGRTLAAAAVVPLAPARAPVSLTAAPLDGGGAASTYTVLTPSEAAFTEAMVTALCPADALTPDGVTSGLAAFIDAHLASTRVEGQRALFAHGAAAADAACVAAHGVTFAALPVDKARAFLRDIASGDVAAGFPLAAWRADVVDPLLKQACFSGTIYSNYEGRMFWKLFG